jgi:hypothetical protein
MPALVIALVANSKMLPHQFLPNAMQWTPATNNINHLDFIPDGPEFAPPQRAHGLVGHGDAPVFGRPEPDVRMRGRLSVISDLVGQKQV